jgi:oligosaccharide repeat unit polymerase
MEEYKLRKNTQRSDKKKIRSIIFLLMVIAFGIAVFVPSALNVALYFLTYFFLLYLTFTAAPGWISTITVFAMFYTMSFACGQYYVWKENFQLSYNPYLMVLGSYSLLLLGYYYGKNIVTIVCLKFRKFKSCYTKLSMNNALYITFIFSCIMLAIYLLRNRAVLTGNLQSGRIEAASGNGIFTYIGCLHIMTIPLMMIQCQNKKIRKSVFYMAFIVAFGLLMMIGFRSPAITMVVVMLIIQIENNKTNLRKAIPIVSVLVVIIAIYGVLRASSNESDISTSLYYMLRGRLFIGMQNLNYVVRCFPRNMPFQHGYTYLINFIMLKPGADPDFTLWLKEALGLSFSGGGVTPTVVGEFYLNFGVIGIIVGMFALGIVFSRVDKWALTGQCGFWKAYLVLELASCCDGGIANISLQPVIFAIYYFAMMFFVDDGGMKNKY